MYTLTTWPPPPRAQVGNIVQIIIWRRNLMKEHRWEIIVWGNVSMVGQANKISYLGRGRKIVFVLQRPPYPQRPPRLLLLKSIKTMPCWFFFYSCTTIGSKYWVQSVDLVCSKYWVDWITKKIPKHVQPIFYLFVIRWPHGGFQILWEMCVSPIPSMWYQRVISYVSVMCLMVIVVLPQSLPRKIQLSSAQS